MNAPSGDLFWMEIAVLHVEMWTACYVMKKIGVLIVQVRRYCLRACASQNVQKAMCSMKLYGNVKSMSQTLKIQQN